MTHILSKVNTTEGASSKGKHKFVSDMPEYQEMKILFPRVKNVIDNIDHIDKATPTHAIK